MQLSPVPGRASRAPGRRGTRSRPPCKRTRSHVAAVGMLVKSRCRTTVTSGTSRGRPCSCGLGDANLGGSVEPADPDRTHHRCDAQGCASTSRDHRVGGPDAAAVVCAPAVRGGAGPLRCASNRAGARSVRRSLRASDFLVASAHFPLGLFTVAGGGHVAESLRRSRRPRRRCDPARRWWTGAADRLEPRTASVPRPVLGQRGVRRRPGARDRALDGLGGTALVSRDDGAHSHGLGGTAARLVAGVVD